MLSEFSTIPQKIFLLGGATGQKILTKTTEAEDLIIFG